MTILEALIAVLVPPLAVFMKRGLGRQFWISVLLTLLGHLPGVIYALVVVTRENR